MGKKILLSGLLGLSLVLTALPLAAAEEAEELQIFEFDYDHQPEAPLVNLPPTISPPPPRPAAEAKEAPIQAPARKAAAPSPAARPAPAPTAKSAPAPAVKPAPSPAAKSAPTAAPTAKATPTLTPAPPLKADQAFVDDPLKKTPPAASGESARVITIIGEPEPTVPARAEGPSAMSEEELLENLFTPQAEKKSPAAAPPLRQPEPPTVNLSPAGSPSPTSVPAKPGEALVEKKPRGTSKAKSETKKAAPPAKAAQSVKAEPKKTAAPDKSKGQPAKAASSKTAPTRKASQARGQGLRQASRGAEQRTPGGALYPLAPGRTAADYRFWELASANWRKVSSANNQTVSGSLAAGRPLYPIDRAPLPSAAPPAGRPMPRNYW